MKISILLPYKENFSKKKSGAVSLFVNDILKNTLNKKDTYVFGKTDETNFLDKNYINLNSKKNFLESHSKIYITKFLEQETKIKSDIIEIHNRPAYIEQIKKNTSSKLILYFHNDPLTMSGSKTINDRKKLLSKVDHFIFNSKWSLERFKVGLNDFNYYKNNFSVVYQSVDKPKIAFNKKQNIISFIGKLNRAKGYDIFGNAIIKVLDKYPNWKAIVIGDEPREQLTFEHPRLTNFGYKDHKFILKKLEQTSISVICSRWNEPLGRASLEACSRGSVPIITNRGGLPETSKAALIIKNLTVKNLIKSIEVLIGNKKLLQKLQFQNYDKFSFTPDIITKKIEQIRNNLLPVRKFNIINSISKIKILHITNFNERYNGRLHYNTGRRLNNGFVRNNHTVFTLSDRDIIHNSKTLTDITGTVSFNKKIIQINNTFKPDLIVIGHADNIKDQTFLSLKNSNKNLKFAQWFLDPVSKKGPDYNKNKLRLRSKSKFMDCSFLTTAPEALDFQIKNSFFIPNPSDHSFETLDNYKKNPENDLFFAMSHGVHRGVLKKGKKDKREEFLNKLLKISNNKIKFDLYGFSNRQPVWGDDFIDVISNSKMGLNLSRGEPLKYYSSDRIAQLFGNGLLTFLDEKTHLNELFSKNEAIFYKSIEDLADKILKFKRDNNKRKEISKNGKIKYMKYYNSNIVSQYIIDKTFDFKSKNNYIWI
jgi:glycosyltransferase involved in cell wall biosynthesis